jgi:hypothetical protein
MCIPDYMAFVLFMFFLASGRLFMEVLPQLSNSYAVYRLKKRGWKLWVTAAGWIGAKKGLHTIGILETASKVYDIAYKIDMVGAGVPFPEDSQLYCFVKDPRGVKHPAVAIGNEFICAYDVDVTGTGLLFMAPDSEQYKDAVLILLSAREPEVLHWHFVSGTIVWPRKSAS